MASRVFYVFLCSCILFVNSAFLPFEGLPHDRSARSPHCWSCEQEYGYPPRDYRGFHHHPNFRSQQWSGLSQTPDGNQVFSGAAASAGEGAQTAGDSQAFSIASAGTGERQEKGSSQLQSTYGNKNSESANNYNAGNQKELYKDGKNGQASKNTGEYKDIQQSVQTQNSNNIPTYGQQTQNVVTDGNTQQGSYGKTSPVTQYNNEQRQFQYGGQERSHGGTVPGGAQTQIQTDFVNHEQRPSFTALSNGNQQFGKQAQNGVRLPEQSTQSQSSSNGYGQYRQPEGQFNEDTLNAQSQVRRGGYERPEEHNYRRNRYQSQSQTSSQGYGGQRGSDNTANEQQNALSQSESSSNAYGNKGQYNDNSNYSQKELEQTAVKDNSHDSLSGALSLANQGLEASRKVPEPCTNCDGKGSIAYSNAKSHSGSAVALSIGG